MMLAPPAQAVHERPLLTAASPALQFRNLDEAAVTLFALLTGDDIHDTFSDIIDGAYPVPIVSRLYIYTFVTIFITSVLNVFIFIIEDSFHVAKMVRRKTQVVIVCIPRARENATNS